MKMNDLSLRIKGAESSTRSPPNDVESFDLRKAAQISSRDAIVEPHRRCRDHQVGVADGRARRRQLRIEARMHARDIEVEGNDWYRGQHVLHEALGTGSRDRTLQPLHTVQELRCGNRRK